MKLPQQNVVTTNIGSSTGFSIAASSQAFEILSSKLYADKPLAICRELICNAIDSHTAAGNDSSINVYVPTTAFPILVIEDFGVGLSAAEVESIYTGYFKSTKQETNELIGGLGLGSKTPFAYTSSFTVIATKNGERNSYIAFIGDNGVPQISLLASSSTDEPNGVRIEVPIQNSDLELFRKTLQRLRWFDTVPTTYRYEDLIERHPQYDKLHRNGYAVGKYDGSNVIAIMGQVAYPIDLELITESGMKTFKEVVRKCAGGSKTLFIKFDIGELDVAASREELSYDKKTLGNIEKRMGDILQSIDTITADIEQKDLPIRKQIEMLSEHDIEGNEFVLRFIDKRAKNLMPGDNYELRATRFYIAPRYWKDTGDIRHDFCGLTPEDFGFAKMFYNTKKPVFVECNGRNSNRIARRVMMAYDADAVFDIGVTVTDVERDYIRKVFGAEILSSEEVRQHIRIAAPEAKKEKTKYPDDRIVLSDGKEVFLSQYKGKDIKFITDLSCYDLYRSLYPYSEICQASRIYTQKIERNGFEVLECARQATPTIDEIVKIQKLVAESMTRDEFLLFAIHATVNGSHFEQQYNYSDFPRWILVSKLRNLFTEKLASALDIPTDICYNSKDKFNIGFVARQYIGKLHYIKMEEVVKEIMSQHKILKLINRSSDDDDCEIVLDAIAKTL